MVIDTRTTQTHPRARTGQLYTYTGPTIAEQSDDARMNDFLGERRYTAPAVSNSMINGVMMSCDSPYGYLHGQLVIEGAGWVFYTGSPEGLRNVRGHGVALASPGDVPDHWSILTYVSSDGRPLVAYEPPTQNAEVGPAVATTVTTVSTPVPTTAPVPVPPPEKIVVKQKPILDQALDEGYNPLAKESPTGLKRPTIDSPTQVLAYLMSCTALNKDLAVNEMGALLEDKADFFESRWPEWAGKEVVAKIG